MSSTSTPGSAWARGWLPSIGARQVRAYPEDMFGDHGRPNFLRSDNGGDFIAASLTSWLASGGRRVFIEKGRPQQNAVVERFNGTMHDEKLGGEEFTSLLEGLVVPAEWIEEYNARRPHGDSG